MNADWKHQFRNRMEQYSEPAPEGLWDEIMTSVESEQKKSGTRFLYILSGIAAAAVLVLAVILPSDKATDTGTRQIAGLQASGDNDMGRIVETVLPPKPINTFQERVRTGIFTDTSKQSESETMISPTTPDADRPGPAEPTAEKPGHETSAEETSAEQADGVSDGYNFAKDRPAERHGDWQDFVLAEASEKAGKSRKMSVNVFASGFPGGSENHTGYSDMVMTAAAAAPMRYGASPLADIVFFNSTQTVETETQHYLPIRAGIRFSWYFTPRWSIESGLAYSWLLSKSRSGSDAYFIDSRQSLHYIGIPLNIGYDFWRNDMFSVYASIGGMLEKCVGGNLRQSYIYGNDPRNDRTDRLTVKPLQWSVSATAGAQVRIAGNIGFFIEPGAIYHFHNGSEIESSYTAHPFNFNLNLGLRFSFE